MGEMKRGDMREWRRIRAWELKRQGWKQSEIAEALGVTPGAVSQWLKAASDTGMAGLLQRVASGRPPRLDAGQRAVLVELLLQGAEAFGFRGDVWTTERVALLIRREFGIAYHRAHVSRILRQAGWTVQKPIRRATQRDEVEIADWRDKRWPAIKKSRIVTDR